jgi:hypothetical protein
MDLFASTDASKTLCSIFVFFFQTRISNSLLQVVHGSNDHSPRFYHTLTAYSRHIHPFPYSIRPLVANLASSLNRLALFASLPSEIQHSHSCHSKPPIFLPMALSSAPMDQNRLIYYHDRPSLFLFLLLESYTTYTFKTSSHPSSLIDSSTS